MRDIGGVDAGGLWRPAVCYGFTLLAMVALALPVRAATPDIVGEAVNGTTGETVSGLTVTLHALRGGTEASTESTSTDESGRFSFGGVETGADWTYSVSAEYQDASYRTDPVPYPATPPAELRLTVYDSTTSAADIRIAEWVVWLDEENGLAVQHDLEVVNSGTTTYVGSATVTDGQRAVVHVPLVPGAADLQYLGSFMECCALVGETDFVHTGAIPPGSSRGTLRYEAPVPAALTFGAPYPVDAFTLLVPSHVGIQSSALTSAGETEDRGITYRVFTASGLEPNSALQVGISGVGESAWRRRLLPIVVVAGLATAVGGGAWVTRRRRARKTIRDTSPRRTTAKPGKRDEVTPASKDEDLVLEELALLDVAYRQGLIAEDVYRPLRTLRKEELRGQREIQKGAHRGVDT